MEGRRGKIRLEIIEDVLEQPPRGSTDPRCRWRTFDKQQDPAVLTLPSLLRGPPPNCRMVQVVVATAMRDEVSCVRAWRRPTVK
ncbi:unnamed protein product [Gadus morhua 'NCC']